VVPLHVAWTTLLLYTQLELIAWTHEMRLFMRERSFWSLKLFRSYNPPAHDVHIMAKTMQELFVAKWEPQEGAIMEKWRIGEAHEGS
jgi:hypothetical protein